MLIEFDIPSPVDAKSLTVLVRSLCALDLLYLQRNPRTPELYKSGVRYKTQPYGVERFLTIPLILQAGEADCDQLAPWRAAELRFRHGIKALPEVRKFADGVWHVYVRYPNGKAEDPSAWLGMKVPERLASMGRAILARNGRANVPPQSVVAAASWSVWNGWGQSSRR